MNVPFTLGPVWHFGLAVRDPRASAKWFMRVSGLSKQFEYEGGVGIGNANTLIVFTKGKPSPKTIGHVAFHLPTMTILKKALAHLKKLKVQVEDPGMKSGPWRQDPRAWGSGLPTQTATGGNWQYRARSKTQA